MTTGPRRVIAGDRGWPPRLAHLDGDEPRELWVLGRLPPPGAPAVAVVGSRRPSPAGLLTARDVGVALAAAGIVVVSGMARGVDAAAHLGALDAGGITVAVLGCGIAVCYPPELAPLRSRIAATGAVVSEDGGDETPLPWRFPRRNRIIAALAEAVVVVEASERSGALSTARWANDLGRDILAVPGSIRAPTSRGGNLLLRDGARPWLGIEDLYAVAPELQRGLTAASPPADLDGGVAGAAWCDPTGADPAATGPDPVLTGVLDALAGEPAHPDELAAALGLSAPQVSTAITTLSLRGAVTEVSGGRVARTF